MSQPHHADDDSNGSALRNVASGDVILRASVDGTFQVFDAAMEQRLTGPLTLLDALAFAERYGAETIYEQPVDASGRILSAPRPFRQKG